MELISVFTDPSFLSECLQCPGILITARFLIILTGHRIWKEIYCGGRAPSAGASTGNQGEINREEQRAGRAEGIRDHARVQHEAGLVGLGYR